MVVRFCGKAKIIWIAVLFISLIGNTAEARWRDDSASNDNEDNEDWRIGHRQRLSDAELRHRLYEETGDTELEDRSLELELQRLPRQRLLSHRRHRGHAQIKHSHHHQQHRDHDIADPLELVKESSDDYVEFKDLLREHSRGKRHNRRRAWTESDKKSFSKSRPTPTQFDNEKSYEVEVREAQNRSLCNYTVIPIADPGGRIPRELEHIKCNHWRSKYHVKENYCCIQTYRNVEVMYEGGKRETLKVYSGCVCSLQIYGTLEPYTPEIDIDD